MTVFIPTWVLSSISIAMGIGLIALAAIGAFALYIFMALKVKGK